MPDDVLAALQQAGLVDDYARRPPYQRNDYLGWIMRARTEGTRERRIQQMLNELSRGGIYMGMSHAPSAKTGLTNDWPRTLSEPLTGEPSLLARPHYAPPPHSGAAETIRTTKSTVAATRV